MSLIPDLSQTNLIIAGDFNCVLDPYLDRSSTRRAERSNSSLFLNTFINNTNLSDIWRIANPTGRDYSFYSASHNSYSRIDYFLIDAKLTPYAVNPKYHCHSPPSAPVCLVICTTLPRILLFLLLDSLPNQPPVPRPVIIIFTCLHLV